MGREVVQLLAVVGEAGAQAAEGVGGADDDGVSDRLGGIQSLVDGVDGDGLGDRDIDLWVSGVRFLVSIYLLFGPYVPFSALANRSRSSLVSSVLMGVPSTLMLKRSKMPILFICTPTFSPVWPPKVSRMPSGSSRSMTCVTYSGVTGRK